MKEKSRALYFPVSDTSEVESIINFLENHEYTPLFHNDLEHCLYWVQNYSEGYILINTDRKTYCITDGQLTAMGQVVDENMSWDDLSDML